MRRLSPRRPETRPSRQSTISSGTHRITPGAEHGRTLLRQATVPQLGRREEAEARLFLALSSLPHPGWLHAVCEAVGSVATGGAIWVPVEFMLLGRKPRGRSYPSGHAATSFAGAWLVSSIWPRQRPLLLGLATLVSLSRVYLGAHDPDEVMAGSLLGITLAEMLRRPLKS